MLEEKVRLEQLQEGQGRRRQEEEKKAEHREWVGAAKPGVPRLAAARAPPHHPAGPPPCSVPPLGPKRIALAAWMPRRGCGQCSALR